MTPRRRAGGRPGAPADVDDARRPPCQGCARPGRFRARAQVGGRRRRARARPPARRRGPRAEPDAPLARPRPRAAPRRRDARRATHDGPLRRRPRTRVRRRGAHGLLRPGFAVRRTDADGDGRTDRARRRKGEAWVDQDGPAPLGYASPTSTSRASRPARHRTLRTRSRTRRSRCRGLPASVDPMRAAPIPTRASVRVNLATGSCPPREALTLPNSRRRSDRPTPRSTPRSRPRRAPSPSSPSRCARPSSGRSRSSPRPRCRR